MTQYSKLRFSLGLSTVLNSEVHFSLGLSGEAQLKNENKTKQQSTSFDHLIGGVCRNDRCALFPTVSPENGVYNLILNTENSEPYPSAGPLFRQGRISC